MGWCERVVSGGAPRGQAWPGLPGRLAFPECWGCWQGLSGCLLGPHPLCETAFHSGCCKAHPQALRGVQFVFRRNCWLRGFYLLLLYIKGQSLPSRWCPADFSAALATSAGCQAWGSDGECCAQAGSGSGCWGRAGWRPGPRVQTASEGRVWCSSPGAACWQLTSVRAEEPGEQWR